MFFIFKTVESGAGHVMLMFSRWIIRVLCKFSNALFKRGIIWRPFPFKWRDRYGVLCIHI